MGQVIESGFGEGAGSGPVVLILLSLPRNIWLSISMLWNAWRYAFPGFWIMSSTGQTTTLVNEVCIMSKQRCLRLPKLWVVEATFTYACMLQKLKMSTLLYLCLFARIHYIWAATYLDTTFDVCDSRVILVWGCGVFLVEFVQLNSLVQVGTVYGRFYLPSKDSWVLQAVHVRKPWMETCSSWTLLCDHLQCFWNVTMLVLYVCV